MLGSFDNPPFTPWCQVNALITRTKKYSDTWHVIMDLSCPPPTPSLSTNGYIKEMYLGVPCKLHLPSAQDIVQGIKQPHKGSFLYCCHIGKSNIHVSLCAFLH